MQVALAKLLILTATFCAAMQDSREAKSLIDTAAGEVRPQKTSMSVQVVIMV